MGTALFPSGLYFTNLPQPLLAASKRCCSMAGPSSALNSGSGIHQKIHQQLIHVFWAVPTLNIDTEPSEAVICVFFFFLLLE